MGFAAIQITQQGAILMGEQLLVLLQVADHEMKGMKEDNKNKYNDTLERVLNKGASLALILCLLGIVFYWTHRPAQTPAQQQPAKQQSGLVK